MNGYNSNKIDNYMVVFFVLSLLFSGSNVYALAYPILKIAVFLGFIGMFYRFSFNVNNVTTNGVIQLSILLLVLWWFFAILSSIANTNNEIIALAFRYTSYCVVFICISFLRKNISYLFYKWYSEILYYITLLSFFSYILSVFNITPIVELTSTSSRVYLTTFFNIVMSDSMTTIGGFTFYRFQSIFEEPGTFAFLILPVLYWYKIVAYSRFKFISLIIVLLLTLSIGAIFSAIMIFFVYFFIKRPLLIFPLFIVFIVGFSFSLILLPDFSDFLSYKFGVGKYEGQHSSLGVRILEISYVTETLTSHVLGVGFSASNMLSSFGNNVSVGLFRLIMYSGAIGGMAVLTLHVILSIYSVQQLASKKKMCIFVGFTLLSFISMGLQRSTFIDGFMFVTLFSFLLKLNYIEE